MSEKEKQYSFMIAKVPQDQERIFVKESELTKWQKDLLLGEVIKRFNDLPDELKTKFLNNAFGVIKQNQQDNPSMASKKIKEELLKKIEEDIKK